MNEQGMVTEWHNQLINSPLGWFIAVVVIVFVIIQIIKNRNK